jgi:hypothetical protein
MEIALKTIWKPAQPTELELMSAQDFDYFISFKKNPGVQTGTFATVSINIWSLKISEDYKGKTWNCEISGNSIDVYRKILNLDFIKNKENFISEWTFEKNEYQKKLLSSHFSIADTAEQLSTQLHINNFDDKSFADKADKNFSNVWKEVRGKRNISIDQAIHYSQILNCDPVDLLFNELRCEVWGAVDLLSANELGDHNYVPGEVWYYDNETVTVPRDIYRPSIKAIKILSRGSIFNNHIIFYYKGSDTKNYHGKLVIIGKKFVHEEFGIDEIRYYYGIYENARGKINILNPDPFAKNKIVIEDIVDPLFVSPVVAIVDPIITKKSNRVKSAILRKDIQEKIDNVEKTLLETKKLLFQMTDQKKSGEVKKKYQQVLNQYESLLGNLDDGIKTIQRKKTA